MADGKTFRCTVLTPDRKVLECDATFVAFTAHDGEMGFSPQRAPLLCKLGIGELRIDSAGERKLFFIDGGFAQMLHDDLTVLTAAAIPVEDIDRDHLDAMLESARRMPSLGLDSYEAQQQALARARAQRRLVSR